MKKRCPESLKEACRDVVHALGGNKAVGALMWPNKDPEQSGKKLATYLNPDRSEELCYDDLAFLRRLGQENDCHAIHNFECYKAGYIPSINIKPEDLKLAQDYCDSQNQPVQKLLVEEFERWCADKRKEIANWKALGY